MAYVLNVCDMTEELELNMNNSQSVRFTLHSAAAAAVQPMTTIISVE